MSYSREEAVASLHAVETMERRATTLRAYEEGAPYFFLWGTIWIVGYSTSDIYPQLAGLIWLVLNVVGISTGLFISRGVHIHGASKSRYLAVMMSAVGFAGATYFVMEPTSAKQLHAFPALLVSFLYILAGIQRGVRFVITGLLLAGSTLLGFAFVQEHFALWMAVVGGVTLFLTGFWMRRI